MEAWIARWNYKSESSWAWCTYNLDGAYATLTGTLAIIADSYNTTNFDTTIEIYGDDVLLYSYNLLPSMSTEDFSVDVTGVDVLKISLYDNKSVKGGTSFALGNLRLLKVEESLVFDSSVYYCSVGETVTVSATYVSKMPPYENGDGIVWNCADDVELSGTSVAGPAVTGEENTYWISIQVTLFGTGTFYLYLTIGDLSAVLIIEVSISHSA